MRTDGFRISRTVWGAGSLWPLLHKPGRSEKFPKFDWRTPIDSGSKLPALHTLPRCRAVVVCRSCALLSRTI